jgi:hypothetical protein
MLFGGDRLAVEVLNPKNGWYYFKCECGCSFRCREEDFDWSVHDEALHGKRISFVECPECKHSLYLKDRSDNPE